MKSVIAMVVLLGLPGCALVPGAVVGGVFGGILAPFVQPQVDRVLGVTHNRWVDPSGVDAVQQYDSRTTKGL